MRLFHVSEENNIEIFEPRIPDRSDMDKTVGLVWAIDELRLPNFLTPRNCPRVTYHVGKNTTKCETKKYFSSSTIQHVVIIENKWFHAMKTCSLYLYEFEIDNFELQDEIAGYYVSKIAQKPVAKYKIDDVFSELFNRNVELRIVDNLWNIFDDIINSTLNWSACRMRNAQPRL